MKPRLAPLLEVQAAVVVVMVRVFVGVDDHVRQVSRIGPRDRAAAGRRAPGGRQRGDTSEQDDQATHHGQILREPHPQAATATTAPRLLQSSPAYWHSYCDDEGMREPLRIVVIVADPGVVPDDDEHARAQLERSRLIRLGLLEAGYDLVATLPADPFLQERLAQLQADLVIVDAESDARDALEHVVMATRDARRPIVMFTNDDDAAHANEAVQAGVTAYIVAGLAPERIRPILTVAMARFDREQALLAELDTARGELQDRKLIDRAKGLLMQRQGLSEQEAYARLRKAAMNKGVKLTQIAQQMLEMAELLG